MIDRERELDEKHAGYLDGLAFLVDEELRGMPKEWPAGATFESIEAQLASGELTEEDLVDRGWVDEERFREIRAAQAELVDVADRPLVLEISYREVMQRVLERATERPA
jgi:hypothetical protein